MLLFLSGECAPDRRRRAAPSRASAAAAIQSRTAITIAVLTLPPDSSSSSCGPCIIDAGSVPNDTPGAVAKLLVSRLHIHHQIAVHVTRAGSSRRSSACSARASWRCPLSYASNQSRSPGRSSTSMGMSTACESSEDGLQLMPIVRRAELPRLPNRSEHIRRPPAGRDPAEDISRAENRARRRSRDPAGRIVLARLRRAGQRRLAAGDDPLDHLRRNAVRRRAFGCIEHTQPATGASADVEQPATVPQSFRHSIDCPGDLRNGFAHSRCDRRVLIVDDLENLLGGQCVDLS